MKQIIGGQCFLADSDISAINGKHSTSMKFLGPVACKEAGYNYKKVFLLNYQYHTGWHIYSGADTTAIVSSPQVVNNANR